MLVHILESKLPKRTIEKWEATLKRDEFPKPDQLYEFLYKVAVCASRRDRTKPVNTEANRNESPLRKKRKNSENLAFILNMSNNGFFVLQTEQIIICSVCKTKKHPLYMCNEFKQMPVHKRIEAGKNARLCYNCLRSHRDKPCKCSNCTVCQKRHNIPCCILIRSPALVNQIQQSRKVRNQIVTQSHSTAGQV